MERMISRQSSQREREGALVPSSCGQCSLSAQGPMVTHTCLMQTCMQTCTTVAVLHGLTVATSAENIWAAVFPPAVLSPHHLALCCCADLCELRTQTTHSDMQQQQGWALICTHTLLQSCTYTTIKCSQHVRCDIWTTVQCTSRTEEALVNIMNENRALICALLWTFAQGACFGGFPTAHKLGLCWHCLIC